MKKIKLSYLRIVNLSAYIIEFKKIGTAISWAVTRSSIFINKAVIDYYKQLDELIKIYANKDENGEPILKDGAIGKDIMDYVFINEQDFINEFNQLQSTEVEIDIYEVTKEKLTQYINTNPAQLQYEIFIGNIINPELL